MLPTVRKRNWRSLHGKLIQGEKDQPRTPADCFVCTNWLLHIVNIQYDDAPLVWCHLFFYLNGGNTLLCLNLTWIRTPAGGLNRAFPVAFSLDALSTWIYDIFSIINPPILLSVYHQSLYLSNICPCLPIYIYLYFFLHWPALFLFSSLIQNKQCGYYNYFLECTEHISFLNSRSFTDLILKICGCKKVFYN